MKLVWFIKIGTAHRTYIAVKGEWILSLNFPAHLQFVCAMLRRRRKSCTEDGERELEVAGPLRHWTAFGNEEFNIRRKAVKVMF